MCIGSQAHCTNASVMCAYVGCVGNTDVRMPVCLGEHLYGSISSSYYSFFSSAHSLCHHNILPHPNDVAYPQTVERQSIVRGVSSYQHSSPSITYERQSETNRETHECIPLLLTMKVLGPRKTVNMGTEACRALFRFLCDTELASVL